MSANNYILIDRDKFEVSMRDADTGTLYGKPKKAENLEGAIDIAEEMEKEEIVEYGITFTGNKQKKKGQKNKTFLYVDGTNLLAGMAKIFGFNKVPPFQSILKQIEKYYKSDRVFFYASFTPNTGTHPDIPKQIKAEQIFFNDARKCKNLTFYKGYRSPTSKQEKGVDVHLAIDIVKHAYEDRYKTALLMTGDADISYTVEIAKSLSKKTVGIFIPNRFSLGIAYNVDSSLVLNYNNRFNFPKRRLPKSLIVKLIKRPRS